MKKVEKATPRFHPTRWAIFAIAVGIAAVTLLAMALTVENGRAIHLKLSDKKGSKPGRRLVIASQLGILEAGVSDDYRKNPPLLEVEVFSHRPTSGFSVPYIVIIGIQCVVLFFLAPSVLTRSNRESPTD